MITPRTLATLLLSVLAASGTLGCLGSIGEEVPGEAPLDPGAEVSPADPTSETGPASNGTDAGSGLPHDGATTDAATTDGATKTDGATTKPDASSSDTRPAIDSASDTATAPDALVGAGPSSSRLVERPLGTTDAPNGFYEYLPPGYSTSGPGSPLMLFWHGVGEDGNGTSDLPLVLKQGPPKLIHADAWPNTRPFVVLSPQNASGCPSAATIKKFLEWSIAHYHLDPARLYLTGLSCGAIGSWSYLQAEAPTTPIAAAVLIAGNGHGAWDTQKCGLGRVAIWGFHGDADPTVDWSGTTYPMTHLMACASPPRRDAEMTIYPGVGHDSWTRTYDLSAGHDVYAWLLDNHL